MVGRSHLGKAMASKQVSWRWPTVLHGLDGCTLERHSPETSSQDCFSLLMCLSTPGCAAWLPAVYSKGKPASGSRGCGEIISPSKEHCNLRSKGSPSCKELYRHLANSWNTHSWPSWTSGMQVITYIHVGKTLTHI